MNNVEAMQYQSLDKQRQIEMQILLRQQQLYYQFLTKNYEPQRDNRRV
jgi:hypothetical protein